MPAAAIGPIIGGLASGAGSAFLASRSGDVDVSPSDVYYSARNQLLAQERFGPRVAAAETAARLRNEPLLARMQQEIAEELGPRQAEMAMNLAAQYGPQYADLAVQIGRVLDPEGTALRKQVAGEVSAGLESARTFTPEERTLFQQQIRGAQVARGNVQGPGPIFDEAAYLAAIGEQRYAQRLGQAQAFLAGAPSTALASGGAGGAAGVVPGGQPFQFTGFQSSPFQSVGQAFGQAQNFLLGQAQLQASTPNPWAEGLGAISGGLIQYGLQNIPAQRPGATISAPAAPTSLQRNPFTTQSYYSPFTFTSGGS